MKTAADKRRLEKETSFSLLRKHSGDLDKFNDEELLIYARTVTGADNLPYMGSVPGAFRRLAEMVDKLSK